MYRGKATGIILKNGVKGVGNIYGTGRGGSPEAPHPMQ